jgi:hypothetical protein
VRATARDDALHVAIPTCEGIDALVSWNHRDLVRLDKIRHYTAVNLTAGYPAIEIRTPREVLVEGQPEEDETEGA